MTNEEIVSNIRHTRPSASVRWDHQTCDLLKMVNLSFLALLFSLSFSLPSLHLHTFILFLPSYLWAIADLSCLFYWPTKGVPFSYHSFSNLCWNDLTATCPPQITILPDIVLLKQVWSASGTNCHHACAECGVCIMHRQWLELCHCCSWELCSSYDSGLHVSFILWLYGRVQKSYMYVCMYIHTCVWDYRHRFVVLSMFVACWDSSHACTSQPLGHSSYSL